MDDVPPGPTGPGPRRPALSVVIPVHNGGNDFECCLRRLRESRGVEYELIVVDDGSTDASSAVAQRFGACVISHATPQGPASARNLGARAATAPIVFFLDADVSVHPDALSRAMRRFEKDPGLTALFGSYDDQPTAPGLVSRFRNLLHHFVHQQGAFVEDVRPAHSFWTGCGAIQRQAFLDLGGFDPRLYARPAIEDIELGYRLARAGHRILLARDVQGTHLKRWTLPSVIKTDIFQRGVPWMILMKRLGVAETDLNVRPEQKICVAASGLAVMFALLGARWPTLLICSALCLATIVTLNRGFYGFLLRKRGLAFAVGSVPLHLVYYGCCGASVVLASLYWHLQPQAARRGDPLTGPWGLRRRRRITAEASAPAGRVGDRTRSGRPT
ncbi:MAG: glycosyltransferase family A protein [Isosphaeraceae bacterium]